MKRRQFLHCTAALWSGLNISVKKSFSYKILFQVDWELMWTLAMVYPYLLLQVLLMNYLRLPRRWMSFIFKCHIWYAVHKLPILLKTYHQEGVAETLCILVPTLPAIFWLAWWIWRLDFF